MRTTKLNPKITAIIAAKKEWTFDALTHLFKLDNKIAFGSICPRTEELIDAGLVQINQAKKTYELALPLYVVDEPTHATHGDIIEVFAQAIKLGFSPVELHLTTEDNEALCKAAQRFTVQPIKELTKYNALGHEVQIFNDTKSFLVAKSETQHMEIYLKGGAIATFPPQRN